MRIYAPRRWVSRSRIAGTELLYPDSLIRTNRSSFNLIRSRQQFGRLTSRNHLAKVPSFVNAYRKSKSWWCKIVDVLGDPSKRPTVDMRAGNQAFPLSWHFGRDCTRTSTVPSARRVTGIAAALTRQNVPGTDSTDKPELFTPTFISRSS